MRRSTLFAGLISCVAMISSAAAQPAPTWSHLGPFELPGAEPRERLVDDLDADGNLDIVIACGQAAIVP